jgi:hypothetical protein
MHNMPVVSECKLNQVDIVVGEPLSTSVQCPEIPLPSFLLPSLSQIIF